MHLPVLDGAEAGTGAEVAAHELVGLVAHHLVDRAPDEAVARAVGAVLADVVGVGDVTRDGIAPGVLGHVVVEGGVGHDDVAELGEHVAADLDDVGLGVVVQRSQRRDLADLGERLVGHDGGLGEVPAALDHAVADAADGLVNGLEDVEDVLDGGLVVRERDLELLLLPAHLLVTDEGTVDADALAVALGVDLARVHVQELVLERRAAGVTRYLRVDSPPAGSPPLGAETQHSHDTPGTSPQRVTSASAQQPRPG